MPPPDVAETASPEGLPIGTPAPWFQLPTLQGTELSLDDARGVSLAADGAMSTTKPSLLVFIDPECGPCSALLPDIGRWQQEHAATLPIAVISRGGAEANRPKASEHGVAPVLLQNDYEVADLYRVFATPSAVLIRPDGTIGSVVAGGPEQIRSLVAHVLTAPPTQSWLPPLPLPMLNGHTHDHQHAQAGPTSLPIGDPAPPLVLPDLDGQLVDLADFRGRETVLVFWSPTCGFCQQVLPELRALETDPSPGAPRLLIVSSGLAEQNRAMGLASPIVLDQEFRVGAAFGADGTPSAVLIDGGGRVASELAVGAPRVLALAGVERRGASQSSH